MKKNRILVAALLVWQGAGISQAAFPKPPSPPPPPPPPNQLIDAAKQAADDAAKKAREAAEKAAAMAPPVCPALPPPPPLPHPLAGPVTRQQRALLVISAGLARYGDDRLKSLYQFAQSSGATLPKAQLGPVYEKIVVLDRGQGTVSQFYNNLSQLAASYSAVDVIIHSHGQPNSLLFEDGSFTSSDLANVALGTAGTLKVSPQAPGQVLEELRLPPLNRTQRGHLRLVYETACFGESHADGWLKMGFDVAAGAHQVHADSAASFPTFVNWWGAGYTFGEAVDAANRADPNRSYDKWCDKIGLTPADSQRSVKGRRTINLATSPGAN